MTHRVDVADRDFVTQQYLRKIQNVLPVPANPFNWISLI